MACPGGGNIGAYEVNSLLLGTNAYIDHKYQTKDFINKVGLLSNLSLLLSISLGHYADFLSVHACESTRNNVCAAFLTSLARLSGSLLRLDYRFLELGGQKSRW